MMLTTMTTVTFYMITVYTPTFGKTVLKLTETNSLIVTLCVAITQLHLAAGGRCALSDAIGRKRVLLTISVLSLLTTYPALHWLVADPTFGKMLAVELWFSFFFGVYNGAMVVSLSEVVPPMSGRAASRWPTASPPRCSAPPPDGLDLPDREDGDRASPSYWLMAAAACGIVATLALFRVARRWSASPPTPEEFGFPKGVPFGGSSGQALIVSSFALGTRALPWTREGLDLSKPRPGSALLPDPDPRLEGGPDMGARRRLGGVAVMGADRRHDGGVLGERLAARSGDARVVAPGSSTSDTGASSPACPAGSGCGPPRGSAVEQAVGPRKRRRVAEQPPSRATISSRISVSTALA